MNNCDGNGGKMEKGASGMCGAELETLTTAVMGVREGYHWWRNPVASAGCCGASWSLLGLSLPNKLPSCMIILALNSHRMSETNSPFTGLDLLKRPPWSEFLGEVMLVQWPVFW